MSDDGKIELLNGREATDFELAAVEHGRKCDLARDAEVVAGLLAEYPREPSPVLRPVTELAPLP
ncbi:MAG TPA: hypothetical protein VGL33_30480 [Streptosporangiaceae bacterium]|jgi:hypothetical protein